MPAVILYVEDNDYVRDSVAELLQGPHRRFICCADSTQALRVLEREPVDLLITDLNLPGLSGSELIRRALQLQPQCPILVCSGHAMSPSAFDATRVQCLRKPFELEELEATVDRLLGQRVA